MRALRWHDRGDVRVEDVDLRLALGPGIVEIEVAFCGICGSDLAEYGAGPFAIRRRPHVLSGQQPPLTLGHELSGRISALGPGVSGIAIGDRVAVDACWRCGSCPACRRGDYNRCPSGGSIGLASDGGFAERVRVPDYCVVPLPDAVSDRAGALLEPLAVGLHALDRARVRAGDAVGVLGFGPIGACTAAVAEALGLRVLVIEPQDARRARAETLGHETLAPTGDPRQDARTVRERTGGGVDAVLDCTGSAAALGGALEMTPRGGTIVVVGLPKTPLEIDASRLVLFERALVGTLGYAHDLPRVAALIAAGQLDAERLITGIVGLEQAPAELERLSAAPGDEIKVLVEVGA